jgi:hypothetical protein
MRKATSLPSRFIVVLALGLFALCASAPKSLATPPNYTVTTTTGVAIVPGTTDVGNHCDDCMTNDVPLPFPVTFYDKTFTNIDIGSNGHLTFTSADNSDYNFCIPHDGIDQLLAPGSADLYTADAGSGQGIFTSVSGTRPNRIFTIEWRTQYCCNNGPPIVNFEARFYEGEQRIDFIYGAISSTGLRGIGIQRDIGSEFVSLLCDPSGGYSPAPASGTQYTFRPIECVTPPSNMVGWWPGDSSTLDLIGGNNGTLQNGAGYTPGHVSGAFTFNGSGQFVSVGDPPALQITGEQVTLDGWINPAANGDATYFGKAESSNNDFCLFFLGGNIQAYVKINGTEHTVNTGYVPTLNTWTHIALTYDGSTITLYANGTVIGSDTASGNLTNSGSPFVIGGRFGDLHFNGSIDEVEVFDRALGSAEIQGIYNAGGAGKCKPMGLYAADGAVQNPNCHLFLLNPATGAMLRDIGPIGFAVTGLAFDPATGVLYGVTGGGSPSPPRKSLITIDPITGAGTLVGPEVNGGPIADITFTSDGTFYGWGEGSDDLYTINKSTGTATKVGESSFGTAGSGISANSANILYFGGNRPGGNLTIVDRITGTVSVVAHFSGAPLDTSLNAFAFDPNDVLYASNGGDEGTLGTSGHLVTINTSTAVITDLGVTINDLDAIAFGPALTCDSDPPVITVPPDIHTRPQKKKVSGQKGAYVDFVVSANDPEDGPVPAIANPPSGSFFPNGTTTVTVTATDHCGNTAVKTFTVTVRKKH